MFLPLFDKRVNFGGLLSCFDPLYSHPLAPIGTPIGSVDEHSSLTQNATKIRLPFALMRSKIAKICFPCFDYHHFA